MAASTVSKKQQERITALEANVAELSKLCGVNENDRCADKKLIAELESELEELKETVHSHRDTSSTLASFNDKIDRVAVSRSRATQTDDVVIVDDAEVDHTSCVPKELVDVETQTIEVQTVSKKTELAIVIPTPRDEHITEVTSGCWSWLANSDVLSHHRRNILSRCCRTMTRRSLRRR